MISQERMRKLVVILVGVSVMIFCAPAFAHHNTITGQATCVQNGTYSVAWTIENSEWDTDHATEQILESNRAVVPVGTTFSTRYHYATEIVPGNTTGLTLTLMARWSNGTTHTDSGDATGFTVNCTPPDDSPPDDDTPPTPPTPPKPPTPKYAPRALLQGPCGDPMYRAVYDNRKSNRPVTFKIRFHRYGHGWVTRERTVLAHRKRVTRYYHVTGYTTITIRARGKLLLSRKAAAPGNYAPCR